MQKSSTITARRWTGARALACEVVQLSRLLSICQSADDLLPLSQRYASWCATPAAHSNWLRWGLYSNYHDHPPLTNFEASPAPECQSVNIRCIVQGCTDRCSKADFDIFTPLPQTLRSMPWLPRLIDLAPSCCLAFLGRWRRRITYRTEPVAHGA